MKTPALVLLLLITAAPFANAQKLTASADKTSVALGDIIQVSYKINSAEGRGLTLPALDGLRVITGPETRNEVTYIGNITSISTTYIFAMQAIKKGKLELAPATITIKGKQLQSNPLVIKVSGSKARVAGQQNGTNIFMRAVPDKTEAVQGEAIAVSYKLYVAGNVSMAPPTITKMPTFTGFWAETGNIPPQLQQSRENYKGRQYDVFIIRKLILFPQRTGLLTIDPLEIACSGQMQGAVAVDPNDPFADIFDNLMNGNAVPFHKNIVSEALKINVNALPENGRPASFTGMVGKAVISANMVQRAAKANDPVTYRITIGGEGNLSLQRPLKLNMPADIEVYDPKTIDKIDRSGNNLTGTRTFEYTLMPHKEGNFEIPSISFSYFDPLTKKYSESKTGPVELKVEKNSKTFAKGDNPYSKNDKQRTTDYITWGVVAGTGALLLFAVLLFVRKKPKGSADPETMTLQDEFNEKDYAQYLEEASQLVHHDSNNAFFTVMLSGLYRYMEQFLDIPFAHISHETIRTGLKMKNIPEELIKKFILVIDECEMVKFAPAGFAADKADILKRGREVVAEIGS
jgi:hypothetical protein